MSGVRTELRAELAGRIWKVLVAPGDGVRAGQQVVLMETMKMEIPVESDVEGTVIDVPVQEGQQVGEADVLIVVEASS
jgi:acetyl-CoA carboxylase biotin carboxyl carrier protein